MPKKTKTEIKTAIKNVLNKVTIGSEGGSINGSIVITGENNFVKAPAFKIGDTDLSTFIEEAGKVKTVNNQQPDSTGNIDIPISVNNIQRDATGNITLTPADIGASPSDHTHDYLPSTGKAVSAGSADTATKATQDGSGQVITDNYIKAVSVSGRTVTFTRGNGTTFSITTQDTVTHNTSNWSVSGGGNGWARDNSTGFTIVWGTVGPGAWAGFARTFGSVLAVTLGPWDSGNYSWGNNLGNTGFTHNSSGNCKYIAVGFS
jgi:hypothetical protein